MGLREEGCSTHPRVTQAAWLFQSGGGASLPLGSAGLPPETRLQPGPGHMREGVQDRGPMDVAPPPGEDVQEGVTHPGSLGRS